MLHRVERIVAPERENTTYYGWEPLDASVFLSGLATFGNPAGRSFVDIGCGIGTKLALAEAAGWENLAGVERDGGYAEIAMRVCPDASVSVGDALDFTYEGFDVVFMFRPMVRDEDQMALERGVVARMCSGAFAFFPHAADPGPGAHLVAEHVWLVL